MSSESTQFSMQPEPSEYAAFYGGYVALVPAAGVMESLHRQLASTFDLFRELEFRYRPQEGKWTLKQVLGHCIDTERVMAYRALRIGRNDNTPLPSFDQDLLVANGPFEGQALEEMLAEWESVRLATLSLFRGFDAVAWQRLGTASGSPISTRALAYIIAGHELHHARLLERYLAEESRG